MALTDEDRAALAAMAVRADTDDDSAQLSRLAGQKDAQLRDLLRGITERTGIR